MNTTELELLTNRVVLAGTHLVREAARLFKPYGISPAQFNVLHLLQIYGDGMRPSEISQRLVVDPASATYLMDQLEKRAWIVRADDPEDRRAYRIMRTREGRQKLDEVLPIYQRGLEEVLRRLGKGCDFRGAEALVARLPDAARESTDALLEEAAPKKKRAKRK